MSEQELVIFEELKRPMAIGQVFASSGMFPDVKSQAQAVVKIMAGKELGLSPFESMAGIYVVNGKLALTSKVMSGLIKRSKTYDYVVKKLDDQECIIVVMKDGKELGTSSFSIKDAARAGLINKEPWKAYPRNMLFARAVSNACRFYCPEVVSGYYTVEELSDVGSDNSSSDTELPKTTVSIEIPLSTTPKMSVDPMELPIDAEVTNGKA